MTDPFSHPGWHAGLQRWADGLAELQATTTATSTAILHVLLPPYTDYQSAQTTEAGYARHRAAYVQTVRRQDGAMAARLARLNLAAMPDASPVVYGGVALYTADDWLRRVPE